MKRKTEIFSIFGQIEAVVADAMVNEGKLKKIEAMDIPQAVMVDSSGRAAFFAVVVPPQHQLEFEKRIMLLRE